MSLLSTNTVEVKRVVNNLKNQKSGVDIIKREVLQVAVDEIVDPLTFLMF